MYTQKEMLLPKRPSRPPSFCSTVSGPLPPWGYPPPSPPSTPPIPPSGRLVSLAVSISIALDLTIRLRRSSIIPELLDILLNRHINPRLELRPVAEHEENLHPDEERRQKQRLHEVVEQRRRAAFEDPVADELRQPGEDVHAQRDVVGRHAVIGRQVVGVRRAADEDRGEHAAGYGFHEDVEGAVDYGGYCAEIRRQVGDAEPWGQGDGWGVCALERVRFRVFCAVSGRGYEQRAMR